MGCNTSTYVASFKSLIDVSTRPDGYSLCDSLSCYGSVVLEVVTVEDVISDLCLLAEPP